MRGFSPLKHMYVYWLSSLSVTKKNMGCNCHTGIHTGDMDLIGRSWAGRDEA